MKKEIITSTKGLSSRRLYFDYAASTPVAKEVLHEMEPYFSLKFGNSGSLHSFGQEASAGVSLARERISRALGLPDESGFHEIIFTGSATEANNLALRGVIKGMKNRGLGIMREGSSSSLIHNSKSAIPRVIISAIEHESVLETAKDLEKCGEAEVIYLPVDSHGVVDLKKFAEGLNERTVLVSVMHASNEIGTIQPLAKIAEIIRNFRQLKIKSPAVSKAMAGKKKLSISNDYPLLHTDAAQTFNYLDCNPDLLGVDLMTLSAQKMYGPKGVGALYMRRPGNNNKNLLMPIITGGSHEFGFRAGTPNTPAIVGFGKAAELAVLRRKKELRHVSNLSNKFWRELKNTYPKAELNGYDLQFTNYNSLPSILNIYFPEHLASDLLIKLDIAGVAAASGSACSTRSSKPSHVLRALGLPMERVMRSVRFSFGSSTTEAEIKELVRRLKKTLK